MSSLGGPVIVPSPGHSGSVVPCLEPCSLHRGAGDAGGHALGTLLLQLWRWLLLLTALEGGSTGRTVGVHAVASTCTSTSTHTPATTPRHTCAQIRCPQLLPHPRVRMPVTCNS